MRCVNRPRHRFTLHPKKFRYLLAKTRYYTFLPSFAHGCGGVGNHANTIFAQPQFDQRDMLEEARWTVASQSCSMCETFSKAQRISALDREYRNALQELNTWL
jgi:hypothetical protein